MNMRFFNRRRYPRQTANEVVWIEKVPTVLERCTLVDVSESGARLTISDVYDLPAVGGRNLELSLSQLQP